MKPDGLQQSTAGVGKEKGTVPIFLVFFRVWKRGLSLFPVVNAFRHGLLEAASDARSGG